MYYYIKMKIVKDSQCLGQSIIVFDYKSEIKSLEPYNNKELINEAVNFYTEKIKEQFSDFDSLIIEAINLSCRGIQNEFKEIPEQYKELFETSQKEKQEILDSKEYKIEVLKNNMNNIKQFLGIVRKEAEELEMLDSQEFLEYQDVLNKYSLDPDRK